MLFEQAWHSVTLAEYPPLSAWLAALAQRDESEGAGVNALLQKARQLESEEDLQGALIVYQKARRQADPESALQSELGLIIEDLGLMIQGRDRKQMLVERAAQLEAKEAWGEAAGIYLQLVKQASDPTEEERWQQALSRSKGRHRLATLFLDGEAAFENGASASARELLTYVVGEEPDFSYQG